MPLASARSAGARCVRATTSTGPRAHGRRACRRRRRVRLGRRPASRAFLPEIVAAARHGVHRQLERVPDGSRRCRSSIPEVNPEALEGWPRPGDHRRAELHDDHGDARRGAAAPCRRSPLAGAVVVPGRERRRAEGDARACRADREAPAGRRSRSRDPDRASLPPGELFAKPIAYNVVAKIGEFEDGRVHRRRGQDDGRAEEDPVGLPDLRCARDERARARWWRDTRSRSSAEFARPIDVARGARACCRRRRGSTLMDDPADGRVPQPAGCRGRRRRLVGQDPAGARAVTTRWRCSAARTTSARARRWTPMQIAEALLPAAGDRAGGAGDRR